MAACVLLNDPNCLINRADGAVFTDLPWVFNLSGSYHPAVAGSAWRASTTPVPATR